ncbi:FHA domain-containing protein [Salinilacihabitans rarus]|uniref:FHA domain-containing protein n=1 Tax=Salinilacihabitans rarus TaxID=2961596 RepID=UPI0020C8B27D|nr:zinc ribbon domain-containing protein [Salinilacihabitans rarus]
MPAQEQTELTCVSCDTTFDPAPNGGFCPNCDTPHPDYEMDSVDESDDETAAEDEEADADADGGDDADAESTDAEEEAEPEAAADDADADEIKCDSCGATADADASFCPDCGSELGAEDADGSDDESESESVSESEEAATLDECPDCGTEVDGEVYCPSCGTHLEPYRSGEADVDAREVTLVIDGESYTFGDGDTFGRQDADWLNDLVEAAGGREAVTYVSGDHLEFSVEDDGVYVTDVSTNGTALNGEDMDGATEKLADGDTLELAGRAEIDVQL